MNTKRMILIVFAVLAFAGTATAQDEPPEARQTRVPDLTFVLHMFDTKTETPWTIEEYSGKGLGTFVGNVFYTRSKTDKRFNDYPCGGSAEQEDAMLGTCNLYSHPEERQTFLDEFYFLPEPPQADREIFYNVYAIADELPYTVIVDHMMDQSRPDIITVVRGASEIDDRMDSYACEETDSGYPSLFVGQCQISMARHPDNLIRFLNEFYYVPGTSSDTTVEAQSNTLDGKETYTWTVPDFGVATFQYPSGWFVQESDGLIYIATSEAAITAKGLAEGDAVITLGVVHLTHQLASGLNPTSTARDWLPFFVSPLTDAGWSLDAPRDLTIEGYSAVQLAGSGDLGRMTFAVVNMGNGMYSFIGAVSAEGEISKFDSIAQDILATVIYS